MNRMFTYPYWIDITLVNRDKTDFSDGSEDLVKRGIEQASRVSCHGRGDEFFVNAELSDPGEDT